MYCKYRYFIQGCIFSWKSRNVFRVFFAKIGKNMIFQGKEEKNFKLYTPDFIPKNIIG